MKKKITFIIIIILVIGFAVHHVIPRQPSFVETESIIFENDAVKVTKHGSFANLVVGYVADNKLFALEDHFIYSAPLGGNDFDNHGHFSKINPGLTEKIKDELARSNLMRTLRKNIADYQIVILDSGTILVFYDHIYRSTDGGQSFESVFEFDETIFTPFDQGIAVDADGTVYFGEYNCTKRPHKIRIFRGRDDGTAWDVCHEFPSGDIFHVHAIQYDEYRDRLWITTGDRNRENRLLYTDDKFATVETLGANDQGWRIVSMIIEKDFLTWCSDNDSSGAFIYRYDFASQERQQILFLGKPSYYSTKLSDGTLVISTTYEPSSPFTKQASPDPSSDIWISRDGFDWIKIASFPHNSFDTDYGGSRASIAFPDGQPMSALYFSPDNTTHADNTIQKYTIDWKSDVAAN